MPITKNMNFCFHQFSHQMIPLAIARGIRINIKTYPLLYHVIYNLKCEIKINHLKWSLLNLKYSVANPPLSLIK